MKFTSKVGRSWPAHGVVITVGANELTGVTSENVANGGVELNAGDKRRTALLNQLLGVYFETKQFIVTDDGSSAKVPAAPPAPPAPPGTGADDGGPKSKAK